MEKEERKGKGDEGGIGDREVGARESRRGGRGEEKREEEEKEFER